MYQYPGSAGSAYSAYGATGDQFAPYPQAPVYVESAPKQRLKPPSFQSREGKRINVVGIFAGLFVPWLLFTLVMAVLTFHLHFKMPQLCWVLAGVGIVVALAFGGLAVQKANQLIAHDPKYFPTWYAFIFITGFIGVVLGALLGNSNFWHNMKAYYELQNLNDYSLVDPTRMKGQQMMDAGRVQFLVNSTVDTRRAYAFQNVETYCVAPITVESSALGSPTPLFSYDFWAVGMNCCSGDATTANPMAVNFSCGPVGDLSAHEGVRWMKDSERGFLRLAVQQAESAHKITAIHPLFFHWTANAVEDVYNYKATGYKWFAEGMVIFFVVQVCLVSIVSCLVARWGFADK
jgi:hypothetical protein